MASGKRQRKSQKHDVLPVNSGTKEKCQQAAFALKGKWRFPSCKKKWGKPHKKKARNGRRQPHSVGRRGKKFQHKAWKKKKKSHRRERGCSQPFSKQRKKNDRQLTKPP